MNPGKATSQTQRQSHYDCGLTPERYISQRPRTILFAEDNDDLRYGMGSCLKMMGYHVIACADGEKAAVEFHAHPTIDILVTDYDMPRRTGLELARELTACCPSLPVMVITGSILPIANMQEIKERGWTFLSKPCRMATLEGTLRQILEAEHRAEA